MAVSPINISRISHGFRTDLVLSSLQRTQVDMFQAQAQIASGRAFVTPGDDPVRASRAVDLTNAVAQNDRFVANLRHGDDSLAAADSAIGEISSLLIEAGQIASQNLSNLTSADERASVAELIAGIREELQIIGNTQVRGRFIFGGRDTVTRPFQDILGGIAYVGDIGYRETRTDGGLSAAVNLPGNQLFSSLSRPIETDADLTPSLSDDLRLEDLRGATAKGIRLGTLVISEEGGTSYSVDLTSADTLGDVVQRINDAATEAGSSLTAEVGDDGITINPSAPTIITDLNNGTVSADLGIRTTNATSTTIDGAALDPRVTRLTPIDQLGGGAGIDVDSGFTVQNGGAVLTLDTSEAETVQDLINIINSAGAGLLARISDDGRRIDVFNTVSGTELRIGENGGTTAADLGIRTFDTATSLDSLNFGLGIDIKEGEDDLRITASDGSTVDINLDTAQTIGDVIDLLNDAATTAGVSVQASFAATGNGIQITDNTGGAGTLTVASINLSDAARGLGLDVTADATTGNITGLDTNPARTQSIMDVLIDLERALRSDDTPGISTAAERLDGLREEVVRMHGVVGARSAAMTTKLTQMEDATLTTQTFLSEVRDVDYAEAITELQQFTTQLQANLQTSSALLNLSVLDYLR